MKNVSVIIPAFNAASYLQSAVDSCLRQTFPPREIIVVDDGSQDGTADVCRALGDTVRLERIENGGVARARNIGAKQATGDYFVFLDADDVLLPHALESLHRQIEESSAGFVYGMVIERRPPPLRPRLSGFDFIAGDPPLPAKRNFWRSAVVTPGSAMVRSELHRRLGGFVTGFEPLEDRDYWVKCGLLEPVGYCDTVVLDKSWHPSSHGSQHAKRIFRGQLAQRHLREWSHGAGIDNSWIPSDQEILCRALDEALWRREFGILKPLRKLAAASGLRHWKSSVAAAISSAPEPDWIHAEPRVMS